MGRAHVGARHRFDRRSARRGGHRRPGTHDRRQVPLRRGPRGSVARLDLAPLRVRRVVRTRRRARRPDERILVDAKHRGLEHRDLIADEHAALGARSTSRSAPAYLRDAIRYELGDEERSGLERFYSEAARAGVLPPVESVRFFDDDRRAAAPRVSIDGLLARAADGERLSAADGERLLARGFSSSISGSRPTPFVVTQAPEQRRHVHRRSQRQLHERLHHELPLLRLLSARRPRRGVRALARSAHAEAERSGGGHAGDVRSC